MKICFVGHTFHERTGSTRFIQSLLAELGTVTVLHSSPDDPRLSDDTAVETYLKEDFDLWVFLQTEYVAARLLPLGLRNAVIIPMYDGAWSHSDDYWRQFINCRFATFSRTLHSHLQRLDQRSASFEYWPEPAAPVARNTAPETWSAFFWERKPQDVPSARTVAKQCRTLKIGSLHVHAVPDFPHEAASAHSYRRRDTLEGVALTTSDWFDDKAEFAAVSGAPLFHFAPRLREGIGMMTLEAMARGQIVVAPDRPTANEYIGHRSSGILYDPERPLALPELSQGEAEDISAAAWSRVEFGHRAWTQDRERLISFLLDDGRRWPNTDSSAHFGLKIRQAARSRKLSSLAK
ncbi:glycosyltransferase [Acuticoccus sp. MNP-M23]|uniref:glycosyltransferase n=1 Tax=Acuticoccus sp. MNP-M23 TaxID=3072793 RepID=UPI0028157650|nr:glycosyltransferase [Acuticoccus sp. MNP-M23]WMS40865.1 glycosyltransferase [Acuticoccus sp. MNP-M23]